ncbi:MAG: hypothetical protein ACYCR4_07365 [Acidimicrobiales bacterium]
MHVYDLTGLTRGAGEQRRVIIQSLDVPFQSLVLAVVGFVASLPLVFAFFPLFGYFALLGFGVVEVATFWLFRWRSRSGLRLKNYQAILDSRRSQIDQFIVCGQPFDFSRGLAVTVVASSVPLYRPASSVEIGDLFRSRAR